MVPHDDVRRSLRRGSEYRDMDVPVVSRLVAYGGALVPHDDVRRLLRRGSAFARIVEKVSKAPVQLRKHRWLPSWHLWRRDTV